MIEGGRGGGGGGGKVGMRKEAGREACMRTAQQSSE